MKDPYKKFKLWFAQVKKKEKQDPTAFALGTSDLNNQPHVRMVLLKKIAKDGFIFFTNLNSNKGKQFNNNKKVSMCFYWETINRQIRIVGVGEEISDKESDLYFSSRARGSQIGAWASKQSRNLGNRKEFLERVKHYEKKFSDKIVKRPKYWRGIKIIPIEFEFWKQGNFRMHEREVYLLDKKKWKSKILYP
tara:strand:+ start:102 stop:677 length:576 start_codon:yes stop_codon:yes gene_type:complete